MPTAISNTSPLLYLHRIGVIDWLPKLFSEVWAPGAVLEELLEGRRKGYAVPDAADYSWLKVIEPRFTPPEWLALDLGRGELAVMALASEYSSHIVLLDDRLARRTAQAAGLPVWGTLKVLLEGKALGLTDELAPLINRLGIAGMWLNEDIRRRILQLAGEQQA